MIVGVEANAVRVLTTLGRPEAPELRICTLTQLQKPNARQQRFASTPDLYKEPVSANDAVVVLEGKYKNRVGKVEHVFKGFVFFGLPEAIESGGYVCVRATSVRLRGGGRGGGAAGGGALRSAVGSSPGAGSGVGAGTPLRTPGGGFSVPTPGSSSGRFAPPAPGSFSGRAGGARAASGLVDTHVTVQSGQYKGYRGRVKTETETHVQMELDAIARIVTIQKAHLRSRAAAGLPAGFSGQFGAPSPGGVYGSPQLGAYGGGGGQQPYGGGPPGYGGYQQPPAQAPQPGGYGSKTPLHPTMTPMHPSARRRLCSALPHPLLAASARCLRCPPGRCAPRRARWGAARWMPHRCRRA